MNPILFAPTETSFNTNGIGVLSDAVSCTVTEERNGAFELEMQYPVTGAHYAAIARRCLLLAKPDPVSDAQPFRIYRITRPMGGVVTVYAAHISYDLSGIPVSPFTASSAPAAMAALSANAAVACPFTFWTDKETSAAMTVPAPASIRSLLGGSEGSLLDVYGGEYAFDRFTVRLYGQRGADRGVSIRYGKNLTDLTQEENCQSVYTGCYPYWAGQDGALVTLPEKLLAAEGTYDFVKILPLDLSGEWQEAPTPDALRTRAAAYMKANRIGTPKVSLTVRFAQLEQTEEYKGTALLERVLLCDTVAVEFPALGVTAAAKCVKTVYDCLLERYDRVELGDARATIADTVAEQNAAIAQKPDKTFVQAAVDSATAQITGNKGGYVVLHSSTGAKEPDEVLIMDTPDIATATRVWRWNKAGLGYSSTGYNGPYGLAMTQDGAIVADFITTGTLNAALIKAGVLQDKTGKVFKLDLDAGTLEADFSSLKIAGRSAEEIAQEKADAVSKDLSDYKAAVQKTVDDLQGQIDGSITTWFYPYDPAPDNLPASGWASDAEKENHAGDLFYNTGTGKAYRWALVGGLWRWLLIEDTDVTKALASAQKAQDTADGKRRNFLTQPQPPYDAGDLWSQQTGELLVCKTAKAAGAAFDASDWTGAADYSAQAGEAAAEKINAITQQDIFNKLTNNGAMKGLYMQDGNLYINADYIQSGTIRAGLVSASGDGGSVILSNGAVYVRDQNGYNRFVMFYDAASGNCIFRMRDITGAWCGDLTGYRENDIGMVQLNLSSNGFFRTARIQTGEIAVSNGKMFSNMYRDLDGNSFCYKDGSSRVGCFEKMAISGGAAQNVEWVWDTSISRYVLCTAT